MAVETNIPATGAIAPPPAHATIETAAPVRDDAGSIVVFDRVTHQPTGEVVSPAERAAQNERALAPLDFGKKAVGLESPVTGKDIGKVDPFYAQHDANKHAAPAPAKPAAPLAGMPAASNTDSPSRGIPGTAPMPASRAKAQLPVDGGFGMGGSTDYFPMDGHEVKELATELMDRLYKRIQNDLRFSLAVCYPRIAVKLQLIVESEATVGGEGFTIEYVTAHDKTPIEVAKQHGDSVVFVLVEQRREFNEKGEPETAPDAMRDELGIDKPRKQLVQMGGGKQFSDRPLGW